MDIQINTRVAGIPAVARVTYARYTKPDYGSWASPDDYYGGWTLDWEICDRNGRPAAWLEKKLTANDRHQIEAALIDELEGETA